MFTNCIYVLQSQPSLLGGKASADKFTSKKKLYGFDLSMVLASILSYSS